MHMTPQETEAFVERFLKRVDVSPNVEILLFPPFTSIDRAARLLQGSAIGLGGQDLHTEASGAYTGAISGEMLRASGCRYALAGHSERRHIFGDDDRTVNRKLHASLAAGLGPVLCVGEVLEERKAQKTDAIVSGQVDAGLDGVGPEDIGRVAVAYEPVWAIGTGETATPDQAQETISMIRRRLSERFGTSSAQRIRILYGGSVKPENAAALLQKPDIDGALVGGASLDPEAFVQIIEAG